MKFDISLRTLVLFLASCVIIYLYRRLLDRLVSKASYKLCFSIGLLSFFSLCNLLFSALFSYINSKELLNTIEIGLQLGWWLSLGYVISKVIEYWVWNGYFHNKGVVVSKIIRDFVDIAIFLLAATAILAFVFDKSVLGIFTASGVLAIILGYSAQATLSDIFAGLGLNAAKQFVEGDWIRVDDKPSLTGKVIDINWRFVKLITLDKNHLTIPNSKISMLPIVNFSQPEKKRGVSLAIQLNTKIYPARIKNILESSAKQSTKVYQTPPPKAQLIQFGKDELKYQLFYFTSETNDNVVNDEILSIFWYNFQRETLKATNDENQHIINEDDLNGAPSVEQLTNFLQGTDLFHSLNSNEISALAQKAKCHHYGPPERILEQGQANTSLFLIYKGSIDVFFTPKSAKPMYVATLNTGQYFGEMSLLTGEACNASIILKTESIIIEINHENIAALFAKRSALMEKIGEIVVMRKNLNEHFKTEMTKTTKTNTNTLIDRFVKKMRLFFKHSN